MCNPDSIPMELTQGHLQYGLINILLPDTKTCSAREVSALLFK